MKLHLSGGKLQFDWSYAKRVAGFFTSFYKEQNQFNLLLFIGTIIFIEIVYPAILESVTISPQS